MRKDYPYPEEKAMKIWETEGVQFSIVLHSTLHHYCGYARFQRRLTQETGDRGILVSMMPLDATFGMMMNLFHEKKQTN